MIICNARNQISGIFMNWHYSVFVHHFETLSSGKGNSTSFWLCLNCKPLINKTLLDVSIISRGVKFWSDVLCPFMSIGAVHFICNTIHSTFPIRTFYYKMVYCGLDQQQGQMNPFVVSIRSGIVGY